MAAKIYRINYKSDFIMSLHSDAGWMTPFCIKFWTGAPQLAYFVGWDGTTYTHCTYDPSEPTELVVQFDDHHLPIGDLKYQIAYHFTVADFPDNTEDEVINPGNITTEIDGETYQVILDFTGETAPEIQFALPAYANELQRIINEQQRIADEQTRINNEETRISNEQTRLDNEAQRIRNEQTRITQEESRVREFATLKQQSQAATTAANDAATLANQKAQLAADKAQLAADKADLAQDAATLANEKAQLAADKAALANNAAQLADEKAALAQQKAEYAQEQGNYAKTQGDYAKTEADAARDMLSQIGVFDVSVYNASGGVLATYASLTAALAAIPIEFQIAGLIVKFVNSTSNKYEQYRLMSATWSTTASDWQGVDSVPVPGSLNLMESGGVATHGSAFDISAYNASGSTLAQYSSLSNALLALPANQKRVGMSVKFIDSTVGGYVQYRLTHTSYNANVYNWVKEQSEQTGIYTCNSTAATAAKAVGSTAAPNYRLENGGAFKVKFTAKNTASNPTLKIGTQDAKPLYYNGALASNVNTWAAGETLEVYYDPNIGTDGAYMARSIELSAEPTLESGKLMTADAIMRSETLGNLGAMMASGAVIKPWILRGSYINASGNAVSSSGYGVSDYLPVCAGQKFKVSLVGSASVLVISSYNSAKTFIAGASSNKVGGSGTVEREVEIPSGVAFIRICANISNAYSLWCLNPTGKMVTELAAATDAINKRVEGGTYEITTPNNGYVGTDAEYHSSSAYRNSDFVPVYEGQKLVITADASSSALIVSSFASADFSDFVANVPSNIRGENAEKTYEVVIPSGVNYIVISRISSSTEELSITYEGLSDLQVSVESMSKTVDGSDAVVQFPNGGFVTTAGVLKSSLSYWVSDFIRVYAGQRLTFTSAASSSVLVLSGYTSDSQDSFVSTVLNVAGVNGGTTSVDVVVPDNVKYVRICKSKTYTSEIHISYEGIYDMIGNLKDSVNDVLADVERQKPFVSYANTAPRKPCICFQMDWGYRAAQSCQAYAAKLKQYGVDKSTYALQPKQLELDNDLAQATLLYKAGNEMALHTDSDHASINSESTLTVAQFNELMGTYHKEMYDFGFADYAGCVVLSTALKNEFFNEIKKHFIWTVAGPADYPADEDSTDYLNAVMSTSNNYQFIKRLGVELTPAQVADQEVDYEARVISHTINAIDQAIANNGFLVIYCHSFAASNATYTLTDNVLTAILEYMKPLLEKGMFLTGNTSELIEYYFSKRLGE